LPDVDTIGLPQQPEADAIGLPEPNSPPVSPQEAAQRGAKAELAFQDKLKQTREDFTKQILEGGEGDLRESATAATNFVKKQVQLQAINELAKVKGTPLTAEDIKRLNPVLDIPTNVIEKNYGDAYVSHLTKSATPDWFTNLQQQQPQEIQKAHDWTASWIAQTDYARNKAVDAVTAQEQEGWAPWAWDKAKDILSLGLREEYQLRKDLPSEGFKLLGDRLNSEAIMLRATATSFEDFQQKFDAIYNRLMEVSPSYAAQWARYVEGASYDEQALDNSFSGINLFTAGQIGVGLTKALGKGAVKAALKIEEKDAINSFKDVAKSTAATETEEQPKVVANAAAGNLGEAANIRLADKATKALEGENTKETINRLTSNMDAQRNQIRATHGAYGQEVVNRVTDDYAGFIEKFTNTVTRLLRVERVPEVVAVKAAIQSIKEAIAKTFPVSIQNSILDLNSTFLRGYTRDALTNTYDIVLNIGRHTGEYFWSRDEAEHAAKMMGLVEPRIVSRGSAFYIELHTNLKETDDLVRDLLLTTKSSEAPTGLLGKYLGRWINPDETLSLEHRANRKAAIYTKSVLTDFIKDELDTYIRPLAKWAYPGTKKNVIYKRFKDVLNFSKETNDPLTKQKGYFFQSPAEMGSHYMTMYHEAPTEAEIRGYFSYKRIVEADRMFREMDLYKFMHRVGAKMHTVSIGEDVSPWFAGVMEKEFPTGSKDTFAVLGSDRSSILVGNLNKQIKAGTVKKLVEGVQQGRYNLLQIYDTDSRPLADWLGIDHNIRYVITENAQTKDLPLGKLIPVREGGHFVYGEGDRGYNHYIKQADMQFNPYSKMHRYSGDNTVMALMNRALGQDVAGHLENIRKAIKAKDLATAKNIADTKLASITWKEIKSWFEPQVSPEGKRLRPRLNKDEPIQVVPAGKTIGSMNNELEARYPRFEDGSKQGNLARQFQVEYTGQRDAYELHTMKDVGAANNPIYKYEPAKFIDPIPTLNRAMSHIINSTWMDDYKIYSVEHWLKRAEPYIEDFKDWRNAPFWYFQNGKIKRDVPKDIADRLEDERAKVKQFWGTPSKLQAHLDLMAQNLADSIYKKFGPGQTPFSQGLRLKPSLYLSKATAPADFLRAATFHSAIGLFNPAQFIVQAMTWVNTLGVAGPKATYKGTAGAYFHYLSQLTKDPAILNKFDEMATNFGYKPGEWLEARKNLQGTGFDKVGMEHILSDSPYTPKIVTNGARQFLDMSQMFFKGGERYSRLASWYVAHGEHRTLNPVGAIDNPSLLKILERADILSGNMTKASKSLMQSGIMSYPTQFLSFQMRQAELFLGHRLTGIEKARLFGTYAVMFGIPTAVGTTTGVPFADWFKKQALEQYGYEVGDNFITSAITEGFLSAAMKIVTGNDYNIAERYGSPGLDLFRDVLQGDKQWYQLVGGASGSLLEDAWKHTDGLRAGLLNLLSGNSITGRQLTPSDFVEPLRLASSGNKAWQMWYALNYGRWLSKNETYIDDVSESNAIFRGLTGLQSQSAQDLAVTQWSIRDRKEMQKETENQFRKEYRRAVQAAVDGEFDLARKFQDNASAILTLGDYPPEKYVEIYSSALQDNLPLTKRIPQEFYKKDVPWSKRPIYNESYVRSLRREP
jgi:hypothetical protein